MTDGKYSELNVARGLCLEAGTILAIDRVYNDYARFGQLTRDGVFFVTRMKTNTVYATVEACAVPDKGNVLSDRIVSLPSLDKDGEAPVLLRRIAKYGPGTEPLSCAPFNVPAAAGSQLHDHSGRSFKR